MSPHDRYRQPFTARIDGGDAVNGYDWTEVTWDRTEYVEPDSPRTGAASLFGLNGAAAPAVGQFVTIRLRAISPEGDPTFVFGDGGNSPQVARVTGVPSAGLYPAVITSYDQGDESWTDADTVDLKPLNGELLGSGLRYLCIPAAGTPADPPVWLAVATCCGEESGPVDPAACCAETPELLCLTVLSVTNGAADGSSMVGASVTLRRVPWHFAGYQWWGEFEHPVGVSTGRTIVNVFCSGRTGDVYDVTFRPANTQYVSGSSVPCEDPPWIALGLLSTSGTSASSGGSQLLSISDCDPVTATGAVAVIEMPAGAFNDPADYTLHVQLSEGQCTTAGDCTAAEETYCLKAFIDAPGYDTGEGQLLLTRESDCYYTGSGTDLGSFLTDWSAKMWLHLDGSAMIELTLVSPAKKGLLTCADFNTASSSCFNPAIKMADYMNAIAAYTEPGGCDEISSDWSAGGESGCGDHEATAAAYEVTASGISGGAGCTDYNATHTLDVILFACDWADSPTNPLARLQYLSGPDTWYLSFGSGDATYSCADADFVPLGSSTFSLVSSGALCSGWAATLTVTAVP